MVTSVTLPEADSSVTIKLPSCPCRWPKSGRDGLTDMMDVLTPKATRRSTRIRVEIPVHVMSLDRKRAFNEDCMVLVASAQGCGFRSSQALPLETPVMLTGLPGGGSVTARVANCLPLGGDGKYFLIGAALYTHGNVWGIADAPEDWNIPDKADPAPRPAPSPQDAPRLAVNRKAWPYNLVSEHAEIHPRKK